MISTEIPFVNYVFITITAGVMAFVTLMDEGTVVNEKETTVPPVVEESNDIFSSVFANDNNDSAFNSLPSIFKTPENEEKEVPPPQPISNDVVEQQEPADNQVIPIAEPVVAEPILQVQEQSNEKIVEESENKTAQGGYNRKTKRRLTNNRKTKRK